MKFEELKVNLSKKIAPVYMINGGDGFLTNEALAQIKKALNISLEDFNVVRYGDDYNLSMTNILENCQSLPLVDNFRLVIVDDFVGKRNEGEKREILKYLSSPCKTTCLVFFSTNKSEFFSSFEDKVEFVDCKEVSIGYTLNFVAQRLNDLGLQASIDVKQKLIEYCNNSLIKIDAEISKIFAIKGNDKEVTKEDVENYITKDIEYVIFDLTIAISELNSDKVYLLLDNMLKNKEQPISIISLITNHFRRLFFISRSSFSDAKIGEYLGLKEYAIKKYRQQLGNFSQKELKRIYDVSQQTEFLIKSGKMEAKNAVSYLISSILIK